MQGMGGMKVVRGGKKYSVSLSLNAGSLSVCQHVLAIQSPPSTVGGEAGRHHEQNTGSHAARSRGRRVLSIANNPESVSTHRASITTGFTFEVKNLACYWPILIIQIG